MNTAIINTYIVQTMLISSVYNKTQPSSDISMPSRRTRDMRKKRKAIAQPPKNIHRKRDSSDADVESTKESSIKHYSSPNEGFHTEENCSESLVCRGKKPKL